jgi:adenosylhomocysteine nucleosidase
MGHLKRRVFCFVLWCLVAMAPGGEGQDPLTGILGAFGDEVRLLVERLDAREERKIEGIQFWLGRLKGRRVAIARTGVGKVNAAITATLLQTHFHPTEVLFTGIAGGLNPELKPGDIVIAEKTVHHDYGDLTTRGMVREGARNPVTGQRNPTFLPADARLLKAALAAKERVALDPIEMKAGSKHTPRITSGIVATGDVFVALPSKREELRKELNADAVEMEGAAVAQVCWQWQVPCLVIRSLSDLADENALADARVFQKVAARNSALLVVEIVAHLQ